MWGNRGILEVLCDREHTRLGGGGVERLVSKASQSQGSVGPDLGGLLVRRGVNAVLVKCGDDTE